MNNPRCGACGGSTKRNGTTSSGRRRFRCKRCGSSQTRPIDTAAKRLSLFVRWLLSKATQSEMGYSRSSFKRRTSEFWRIWPISPATGEVHDVVFLDGIWLGRDMVVLIACTREHVVAWHLARSEKAESWAALLARIPPPTLAVVDGAPGFGKAASVYWPATKVQRCLFHAFCQVKRQTTARPKLECGKELYELAKRLVRVKGRADATAWLVDYHEWHGRWESFLKEHAFKNGKKVYAHERLRKARRGLDKLVREKTLFSFIELEELHGGKWPSTTNVIEGGVNARLRAMLKRHRGLSSLKRAKAIFWWCLMHTEAPPTPAQILKAMPTDADIEGVYEALKPKSKAEGSPDRYGAGIDWNEFRMPTEYRR